MSGYMSGKVHGYTRSKTRNKAHGYGEDKSIFATTLLHRSKFTAHYRGKQLITL
jgi:hypothetical protein